METAEGWGTIAPVEGTLATTAQAEEMLLIAREAGTLETDPLGVEAIELDPGISAVGEIEGAMHSAEAGVDLTGRERVWTAIAAHRAWRPAEAEVAEEGSEGAAAEVVAEVVAVDGADSDGD